MNRETWRAMTELRLCMYRHYPDTEAWPVCFAGTGGQPLAETSEAVRLLHDMEPIPWPYDECLVIGEQTMLSQCVPRPSPGLFICLAKGNSLSVPNWYGCRATIVHRSKMQAELMGRSGELPGLWMFARQSRLLSEPGCVGDERVKLLDVDRDIEDRIKAANLIPGTARNFYQQCRPKGDHWLFGDVTPDPALPSQYRFHGSFARACEVLSMLAAFAVPCHYFVRARRKGFGSPRMKKLTRDKPILCVIPYDRLYRMYGGNGKHEVSPHFRNGHNRHLWKRAGINRFALPDSPLERMQLIQRHNVERVYVHPTWVGDRSFRADDTDYEIQGP